MFVAVTVIGVDVYVPPLTLYARYTYCAPLPEVVDMELLSVLVTVTACPSCGVECVIVVTFRGACAVTNTDTSLSDVVF